MLLEVRGRHRVPSSIRHHLSFGGSIFPWTWSSSNAWAGWLVGPWDPPISTPTLQSWDYRQALPCTTFWVQAQISMLHSVFPTEPSPKSPGHLVSESHSGNNVAAPQKLRGRITIWFRWKEWKSGSWDIFVSVFQAALLQLLKSRSNSSSHQWMNR